MHSKKSNSIDYRQRATHACIALSLFFSFSPLKGIAYIAPFILTLFILTKLPSTKIIKRSIIYILAYLAILLAWIVLSDNFATTPGIFSFFTYSAFFLAFAIPYTLLRETNNEPITKIATTVAYIEIAFALIQLVYGVSQTGGFDLANGDFIEGTIHPQLAPSLSFANPMFATACSLLLIFLISFPKKQNITTKICLIGLAGTIVLSSVMHVTVLLLISITASHFAIYKGKALLSLKSIKISALVIAAVALMKILMPSNFGNITGTIEQTQKGDSIKLQTWNAVITTNENILGHGPGQLASKAAFVASGLVSGGFISETINPEMSKAFSETMIPLWNEMNDLYISAGSGQKPYSSWISIYSEFGALGISIIIYIALSCLITIRKAKDEEEKKMAFGYMSIFLFIALIGYQDHYWETPQIMLLAIVLAKTLRAQIERPKKSHESMLGYKHSSPLSISRF